MRWSGAVAAALVLAVSGVAGAQPTNRPVYEVTLEAATAGPVEGRLIIVAMRPEEQMRPVREVVNGQPVLGTYAGEELARQIPQMLQMISILGVSPTTSPTSSTVTTARPGVRLESGRSITVGPEAPAYPEAAGYKEGVYFVQAILDVDGNYAYNNRPSAGDLVSDVTAVTFPTASASLRLKTVVAPEVHRWDQPRPTRETNPNATDAWFEQARTRFDLYDSTDAQADRVSVPSEALTRFHGRPVAVRAYVLRPPGYESGTERYPTVFRTEGFGADFNRVSSNVERIWQEMYSGRHPPMIWVFLDHSGPTGTHEFADSANNGPWGEALTETFIPWLDANYRTDPAARFTTGHSSGGWAALWLQVRYPKLFAGAWPTAPDPVDFRDFTNIDIYAAGANAFWLPDGSPVPLQRVYRSEATVPFKAYSDLERVLGDRGGQLASFEWVFSPRGADGRPRPLFDRQTGAVDPQVAAYWRENYDIAHIIRRDWDRLGPDLDGKIHLWMGTKDTYHLEGAAELLKQTLDELGARSEFHFVEGADHSTFMVGPGADFGFRERELAWQMYRQARPDSPLRQGGGG